MGEGANTHEKGSLVPSQEFIQTVNAKSEFEKEEEERKRKLKEKEENMTFDEILNEGKLSEKEVIEKLERERIEEEERLLRFDERKKEEELKKRMEGETSALFEETKVDENFSA